MSKKGRFTTISVKVRGISSLLQNRFQEPTKQEIADREKGIIRCYGLRGDFVGGCVLPKGRNKNNK
jgi:hypothetical protein